MLQNARVTAFTVSKLLRENQQGEGVKITPPPPPPPRHTHTLIRVKLEVKATIFITQKEISS